MFVSLVALGEGTEKKSAPKKSTKKDTKKEEK